jgi:hypothetical protein
VKDNIVTLHRHCRYPKSKSLRLVIKDFPSTGTLFCSVFRLVVSALVEVGGEKLEAAS